MSANTDPGDRSCDDQRRGRLAATLLALAAVLAVLGTAGAAGGATTGVDAVPTTGGATTGVDAAPTTGGATTGVDAAPTTGGASTATVGDFAAGAPTIADVRVGTATPGGNVTVTLESRNASEIDLTAVPEGWTVETHRDDFGVYANQLDTSSRLVWLWGWTVSANVSVTLSVPGNASPGTYELTAVPYAGTEQGATEPVMVTVTSGGDSPAIPGVSSELAAAVAGGDGTIDRRDVLAAVQAYVGPGSVDGVSISRADVLALVRYYVRQ